MATVLVVACDEQTRKWIGYQLRGQGRTVLTASCLEEMEQAILREPMNLVVIILEGFDGERVNNFQVMAMRGKLQGAPYSLPVVTRGSCNSMDSFTGLAVDVRCALRGTRVEGSAATSTISYHRPYGSWSGWLSPPASDPPPSPAFGQPRDTW